MDPDDAGRVADEFEGAGIAPLVIVVVWTAIWFALGFVLATLAPI